jgi:AcrR family transcriptional regulator
MTMSPFESRPDVDIEEPKKRGRQRSTVAEAAILKATMELLEDRPLAAVTAEDIASRAGVSKATLYKWWPNKNRIALDAFLDRMSEDVPIPDTGSARLDFLEQLRNAMRFYSSSRGRMLSQFIAEGRSDPEFLRLFQERFQQPRRQAVRATWKRGVARGELRPDVDAETVIDLLFGPVVYRLMSEHGPLDDSAAETIVEAVFNGITKPPAATNGKKRTKN